MKKNSASVFRMLTVASCVAMAGCAGIETSSHKYSESAKLNEPVKGIDCYEASVLLGKNAGDSMTMATKVLTAIDATVSEKTATQVKAQRNRHIGLLVGSGGEELSVTLTPVQNDRTFVAVATKTGFVGAVGQKGWSCQVVDQLVTMSAR